MNDAFDPNREIAYGVEQSHVYDGMLYWVDINGYAFHRWTETHMKTRAQPFINAHNAGRTFQGGATMPLQNRESVGIRLESGEPDFMQWMAVFHHEALKSWANSYLRSLIAARDARRGNSTQTDPPQSAP
jgi:hypothetical protein